MHSLRRWLSFLLLAASVQSIQFACGGGILLQDKNEGPSKLNEWMELNCVKRIVFDDEEEPEKLLDEIEKYRMYTFIGVRSDQMSLELISQFLMALTFIDTTKPNVMVTPAAMDQGLKHYLTSELNFAKLDDGDNNFYKSSTINDVKNAAAAAAEVMEDVWYRTPCSILLSAPMVELSAHVEQGGGGGLQLESNSHIFSNHEDEEFVDLKLSIYHMNMLSLISSRFSIVKLWLFFDGDSIHNHFLSLHDLFKHSTFNIPPSNISDIVANDTSPFEFIISIPKVWAPFFFFFQKYCFNILTINIQQSKP
jgi:hypothetical protein